MLALAADASSGTGNRGVPEKAFQELQALVLPLCAADGRLGGQPGRRQTGEQGTGDRKGEEEGAGHDKGRPLAKPQFRQGAP